MKLVFVLLSYFAKGYPLDVSWRKGGRLKKWISFLVAIIHVKEKKPRKIGF